MSAIARTSNFSRRPSLSLLVLGVAVLVAGCGEEPASQSAPQAAAPAAATAAPAQVDPAIALRDLRARADAAIQAQRLFAPAGDNAFELFQQLVQQDPNDPLAAAALLDLQPYAVIQIEGSIARGELAEAKRILEVFEKADPKAPALPRLRTSLANAKPVPAPAAAQPAIAATTPARPVAPPATPPPQSTAPASAAPSVATTTQPPVQSEPAAVAAATPPPAASAPEPTPPEPEPEPAAAPAAATTAPVVVSQVQPRYPPMATRRKLEGWVEVGFTINADGSVADAKVIASDPEGVFDREAIAAMQRWRFAATGKPTPSTRVFDFKLQR